MIAMTGLIIDPRYIRDRKPERITAPSHTAPISDDFELLHPRAADGSGQFTERAFGLPGDDMLVTGTDELLDPIDEAALRAADYEAEAVSSRVGAAMIDGRQLDADESEVSDQTAILFARDALQNLPEGHTLDEYPQLTEFAYQPFTYADGASVEQVDELHAEIARFRRAHNDGFALSPRARERLDHLFTYSLHAIPGHH